MSLNSLLFPQIFMVFPSGISYAEVYTVLLVQMKFPLVFFGNIP